MNRNGTNGAAKELLGPPRTRTYKANTPGAAVIGIPTFGALSQLPIGEFFLDVVQQMVDWDSATALATRYKVAPIKIAEFDVEAADPREKAFVEQTVQRFWQKSIGTACRAHQFGFLPAEALYKHDRDTGAILFDRLKPVHPRDAEPWTDQGQLDHVRVKSMGISPMAGGPIKLRAAREDLPAKGFWLTHDAMWNNWYGRSGLWTAYNPYRLKWMPGGAMETAFKWSYKYGISPVVIRHPDERYQDADNEDGVDAQDIARQLGESIKAGGVVAMSSAKHPQEAGGGEKWAIEWAKIEGHPAPILDWIEFLDKQIQRAILIPDEVITHEGSTGGYSRSKIAALAFFMDAEEFLNHVVEALDEQILRPLVIMNFGKATYRIKPRPLMQDPQQQGQPGMPGAPGGAPAPGGMPAMPGAAAPPSPAGDPPAAPPPPHGAGPNPWVMQAGPRGGHQLINAQTGKKRYGTLSLADMEPAEVYEQIRAVIREKLQERRCRPTTSPA